MGRIWALVGALVAVYLFFSLTAGFIGDRGLLLMGTTAGAGAAAAYLRGPVDMWRGLWLFFGVLFGALGFAIGASMYPDTTVGLFLGATVPAIIMGLATMWQRRVDYLLAALIGSGALAAVYSVAFDLDPQSLNASLPIAVGQTILPMSFGYLAAVLIRTFVDKDPDLEPAAVVAAEAVPGQQWDDATRQIDLEANR